MANVDHERLREIGQRIRARRQELGITQEQLRTASGLSKSFFSEIESGAAQASGLNYLRIAQELQVDLQWLLTGESISRPTERAAEPPIHGLVAEVAEEEGWSFWKAKAVSQTLGNVVARRSRSGVPWTPTREYVERLGAVIDEDGEQ